MRKNKTLFPKIFIFFFLFTCFANRFNVTFADQSVKNSIDREHTQILVKFKNSIKEEEIKNNIKKKLGLKKLNLKKKMKYSKMELLEIDNQDDIDSIVENFKQDPNVEYVQPNYKLKTSEFTPTDEKFNDQWALSNTGQAIQNQNGTTGVDIRVLNSWNITTGKNTVLVGVLDTGVDINHDDLKSNIYINTKEIQGDGIDNDGNGFVDDINGWNFADDNNQVFSSYSEDKHGTHVAGIIAADANNIGIIGVAPSIKIVPLKFMKGNEGYTSDAIDAIEYAEKMGIRVINCSFGSLYYNDALKDAMKASGIIYVCAGGNTGTSTTSSAIYPANYNIPNLVSVAAIDNTGNLASFSAFGPNIDLAAPGVNILSTTPGNKYEYMSGTSMAAPFVTGTAALMISKYDDISNNDVISSIEGSVNLRDNLDKKVTTGGILDTYHSLILSKFLTQPIKKINMPDEVNNSNQDKMSALVDNTPPIPYAQQIHFGEDGVSFSGNYSKTFVDMIINAPGFNINIGRTYNSQNYNFNSCFGFGWTFSFTSKLYNVSLNSQDLIVELPDAKVETFKYVDGTNYAANDSRDKLRKIDNKYILTTKDLINYEFKTNGWWYGPTGFVYHLTSIEDRYGNTVKIDVDDSQRITNITDAANRSYTIKYRDDNAGLIEKISDSLGRTVTYDYDNFCGQEKLKSVTDPANNTMEYDYKDSYVLLNTIKANGQIVEDIQYDYYTNGPYRVRNIVDEYGKKVSYDYLPNTAFHFGNDVIISYYNSDDSVNKSVQQCYDPSGYLFETIYNNGEYNYINYYKELDGENHYGEPSFTRNGINFLTSNEIIGSMTTYDINRTNGNVNSIKVGQHNPKYFYYDGNNNVITEIDENNIRTDYIYDSNSIYLKMKIQPLNGTDDYRAFNDKSNTALVKSKFSITNYDYYTDDEASRLGYYAKGLLKSITDPEGKLTEYTYDPNGNVATIKLNGVLTTTNTYNGVGWLISTISSNKNYKTDFIYDSDGRLEKKTLSENDGETTRITYDSLGRKLKEVLPKQYVSADDKCVDSNKDGINDFAPGQDGYVGDVGTRYTYYTARGLGYGEVQYLNDAEGNVTTYSYDMYGNIERETKPNSAIYRYTYDCKNRLLNTYFSENSSASETLLESNSYTFESMFTKTTTNTKHLNDSDTAVTIYTYDDNNRLINQENPDTNNIITQYYPNGNVEYIIKPDNEKIYYKYDGLNRVSEVWTSIGTKDNTNQYKYKKIEYDNSGNITAERFGKEKVAIEVVPSNDKLIVKTYTYNIDGRLHYVYNGNNLVKEFEYDSVGNITKEIDYQDANNKIITEYDNNQLGKPLTKTVLIKSGDVYGNSLDNTNDKSLVTSYNYDKNGNLDKITTPDTVETSYSYDNLNRQTGIFQQGNDENDNAVTIANETSYNWEGNPSVITKSKISKNGEATIITISSVTTNSYTQRGLLSTTDVHDSTDNTDFVSAYYYDLGGRKIAEVSPRYYDSTKNLNDMNRTEFTYDSMDRLVEKTEKYKPDPTVNTFKVIVSGHYQYDGNNNLTFEQDALGYENGYGKTYSYNENNQISTVQDPVSKERNQAFTMKYDYDGLGRKTSETNAKGIVTRFYYDTFNNITSTTIAKTINDTEKTVKSAQFDNLGNMITSTDSNDKITTYEYNQLNKLRKVTYPGDLSISSNIVTYQYDVMGNVKFMKDSQNKVDIFTYDKQNRQTSQLEQTIDGKEAITTSVKYDVNGNKRFVTDGNNAATEYKYDGINRHIETDTNVKNLVGKTSKVIKYDYDKNNNLTKQTDMWRNIETSYDYDPLNRLITKKVAGKVIQRLEYYDNGLQSLSYDAPNYNAPNYTAPGYDKQYMLLTQFSYDKDNRLTKTIDPKSHSKSQDYDDAGNIYTKKDGKNNTTTYLYDELNNLNQVINAKAETTGYSYDYCGNMLSQTDGKGNVTTYEYNAVNKLLKKIDNGGRTGTPGHYVYDATKTETYTYYPNGNIYTKLDKNGNLTTYGYDIHGRLTSEVTTRLASDGTTGATIYSVSFDYDGNDNKLHMTDATGTTNYSYDEENRVMAKDVPNIGRISYQYDILLTGTDDTGNDITGYVTEKMTDAKGNVTNKTYDRFDRLYKVNSDNITGSTIYLYYDNGSTKSITYSNGSKSEYQYYRDGTLNTLTNTMGSLTETYTYEYDNAHNMSNKVDPKGTTTYTYDSLNRLKTVDDSSKSLSYVYDAAGNRLTETTTQGGSTIITNYHYNDQNMLQSTDKTLADGSIETIIYSYDNNGNLISKAKENTKAINNSDTSLVDTFRAGQASDDVYANDVSIYEYDGINELTQAITGTQNLQYTYYGDGLRSTKTDNGIQTKYIYNEDDKVILEVDSSGNQIARNIQGINQIARTVNGQTEFYVYNGHADVTALLSTTGSAIATYYYDAFGNITGQTGSFNNNITYAGYQYDQEDGLYYLDSRMYDPVTARFMQEDTYTGDPNDPLSLNLYTYCSNEPIMYSDPTGHVAWGGAWDYTGYGEKLTTEQQAIDDMKAADTASQVAKFLPKDSDYYTGLATNLKNDVVSEAKQIIAENTINSNTNNSNTNGGTNSTKATQQFTPTGNIHTDIAIQQSQYQDKMNQEIADNKLLMAYTLIGRANNLITSNEYQSVIDMANANIGDIQYQLNHPVKYALNGLGDLMQDGISSYIMNDTIDTGRDDFTQSGLNNLFNNKKNLSVMVASLALNKAIKVNEKPEVFIRYGNKAEAMATKDAKGLVPKIQNGNPTKGAKWVSEKGKERDVRKLGDPENYTHEITIETKPGTKSWLESKGLNYESMIGGESKNSINVLLKSNELGSYGIGADLLKEFNDNYVLRVIIKVIR